MHRASYRFMPLCGITETLSDVESVRVVHKKELKLTGKEILDNLDLADAMRCNQDFTKFDAKPLLIKLANEE